MTQLIENLKQKHRELSSKKKIEDTYIWSMFDSIEDFERDAAKAGLVEGRHYHRSESGVHAFEHELVSLGELLIEKNDVIEKVLKDIDKYDLEDLWIIEPIQELLSKNKVKGFRRLDFLIGEEVASGHEIVMNFESLGFWAGGDFIIIYEDIEGYTVYEAFITEEAWDRLIQAFPQYNKQ